MILVGGATTAHAVPTGNLFRPLGEADERILHARGRHLCPQLAAEMSLPLRHSNRRAHLHERQTCLCQLMGLDRVERECGWRKQVDQDLLPDKQRFRQGRVGITGNRLGDNRWQRLCQDENQTAGAGWLESVRPGVA